MLATARSDAFQDLEYCQVVNNSSFACGHNKVTERGRTSIGIIESESVATVIDSNNFKI